MPTFAYRVKDQEGRVVTGRVEVQSKQAAGCQIRDEGDWVIAMKTVPAVAPIAIVAAFNRVLIQPLFFRVNLRDKTVMFRELATMVGAGMSLVRALDILGTDTPAARLRQVPREMQPAVETGKPLSDQLARYPTISTEMEVALVRAGERGGLLESMLRGIADHLEYEMELRRTISRETFYPKLVVVLAMLLLALLAYLAWLMPSSPFSAMPWLTLLLQILVEIGVVVVIALGLRVLLHRPFYGRLWDRIKLAIPGIGLNVQKLAVAKASKSLAALYRAGVTISEAVGPAGRSSGNCLIAEAFERCAGELRDGGRLSTALAERGLMPDLVLQMVATGEETGDLDGMWAKVAEYYEDEAKTAIRKMCQAILPISVILLAILVVYVVWQVWLR